LKSFSCQTCRVNVGLSPIASELTRCSRSGEKGQFPTRGERGEPGVHQIAEVVGALSHVRVGPILLQNYDFCNTIGQKLTFELSRLVEIFRFTLMGHAGALVLITLHVA
jgi:hypothetical protein